MALSSLSSDSPVSFLADAGDDACSICLESFSVEDPAAITSCNHEYHLQCILNWSQRSKECPICWRTVVLKDPISQELLAAVEIERTSRRRSSNISALPYVTFEELEIDHVHSYSDGSEFDDHIMQHLGAVSLARARHFRQTERHLSSRLDEPQFLLFAAPSNETGVQETHITTTTESQIAGSIPSHAGDSPVAVLSPAIDEQTQAPVPSSHVNVHRDISGDRRFSSQIPRENPQRSGSSEFISLSESLKSKVCAASSRYKESISKGTRGLKEKLLVRNNSVKELSKQVQREVTAGVARMMERLDPSSKRSGDFSSATSGNEGTSESPPSGKGFQENQVNFPGRSDVESARGTISYRSFHDSRTHSSSQENIGVAQPLSPRYLNNNYTSDELKR